MLSEKTHRSPSDGSGPLCDRDVASVSGRYCRLLYVVGQLAVGGLERQLYYLLESLERGRYRPALVAWNLDPSEKYYRDIIALDVPIYGFPSAWSPLAKLRGLRDLARDLTPEVIHSYGFHTNFAAYYAARGIGAVAIGSLRSDFATVRKVGGRLRGALNARWPSQHISNSVACAEAARRAATFFVARQYSVVRNGLDMSDFYCSEEDSAEKTYVVGVGSLLPVKRWDRLLRVIQIVKDAGEGQLRVRIAGEGPLRASLERQTASLNLSGMVTFLGTVPEVPSLLRGAKFLVHTSESEGCPNVVMEAMACGLPVVAMEAGDISSLVDDGKTGFVVRQNDETALAARIRLLCNDTALCQRMGQAARAKAEREFSIDRLLRETLSVYRMAGWSGAGCVQ